MSVKNRNAIIRVMLLLVLALAVFLVSGCTRQDEPAVLPATQPAAATAAVTASAEVTAAPAAEEPAAPAEAPAEAPSEEALAHAEAAARAEAAAYAEAAAETAEETVEAVEANTAEAAAETAEETVEAVEVNTAEVAAAPAEPVLLVTVNGQEIKSDDEYLNAIITAYQNYAEQSGYDISSPDMADTIRQYSLLYTMRTALVRQKAAELGLDKFTDEENAALAEQAKAEWASIKENYIAQKGLVTETSTEEEKAAAQADADAYFLGYGYDEARYVKEFTESEQENTMSERLKDSLIGDKTVSDEEVLAHFNDLVNEDKENYADSVDMYEFYTNYYGQTSYYKPEGYRAVTHILLPVDAELMNTWKDLSARLEEQESDSGAEATGTEATPTDLDASATPEPTAEPVTPEMVAAAEKAILDSVKPTVDEIKAKLAAGTSFEDLIKEYGTDPGMKNDATRAEGYAVHKDSILWDPAFTAAAMALEKVGDVGEPIVGQNGVHILQYLKDIPGGAVELTDEMKEAFRTELFTEMKEEALTSALDQWMQESSIVYTEDGEKWKIPEDAEQPAEEEQAAAEEPAAETPAPEAPAAEETANP